jgi:hypothetical protein
MAFQELATNAVKYGALSNGAGAVRIGWSLADGQDGRPRLLERVLAHDLDGDVTLEFAATGVVCTLEADAA